MIKILNDPTIWNPEKINIIEQHYNGHYVLESCLKCKDGGWANFPAAIFYTEKAHPEGSNYFALYNHPEMGLYISNGLSAIENPIKGLLIDDTVIYSRYRHDYREFNGIIVDGGRDYFRYGGERINEAKEIDITIMNGEIYGSFQSVRTKSFSIKHLIELFSHKEEMISCQLTPTFPH